MSCGLSIDPAFTFTAAAASKVDGSEMTRMGRRLLARIPYAYAFSSFGDTGSATKPAGSEDGDVGAVVGGGGGAVVVVGRGTAMVGVAGSPISPPLLDTATTTAPISTPTNKTTARARHSQLCFFLLPRNNRIPPLPSSSSSIAGTQSSMSVSTPSAITPGGRSESSTTPTLRVAGLVLFWSADGEESSNMTSSSSVSSS